jgi:hypothetical protein
MISVGRHGSPGRVWASETIHSILIGPVDLEGDAIALHMITLAERKGMSVLRDAASDAEFKNIIRPAYERRSEAMVSWDRFYAGRAGALLLSRL